MKLSGVDANLLAALDALLSERNVTRAAKRLGVGQPAVSHSLARLRNHFQDELLVLRGRTYFLTEKAERLAEVVASATRAMAAVFDEPLSFDAATASSHFVVACSDHLGFMLTPELLSTLQKEAVHVELELRATLATPKASMLDGVDLALGVFEDVPPEMNQETLFEDTVTCVVRESHAGVGDRLTLEAYGDLPHLEIASSFDAIPELQLARALAAAGKQRRVTLRTPYYLLAPRILERTDHVATLPTSAATILTRLARLRAVPPPIDLPPYKFSQIWRNDRNDDRAHTWLRAHIARIFRQAGREPE
jgi:DNA-binding transcriptional LysR family regulator